jgi:hypothetical protein
MCTRVCAYLRFRFLSLLSLVSSIFFLFAKIAATSVRAAAWVSGARNTRFFPLLRPIFVPIFEFCRPQGHRRILLYVRIHLSPSFFCRFELKVPRCLIDQTRVLANLLPFCCLFHGDFCIIFSPTEEKKGE